MVFWVFFCNDIPKYFWQIVVQLEIVSSNFPVYGRWFYCQAPSFIQNFQHSMMSTKIPDSISPSFLLFIILSVFILLFEEKKS